MTYNEIINHLRSHTDEIFRERNRRIINTSYDTVGVRTPDLVAAAKLAKAECPDFADEFLSRDKFTYDELFVACQICKSTRGYEEGSGLLKKLLPRFENWSIVDQTVDKKLRWAKGCTDRLSVDFEYLKTDDTYFDGEFYKRAYIMMLFAFCIIHERVDECIADAATVAQGRYYTDMALAWLLCECLTKFYDRALAAISAAHFSPFVLKKTVSKCRDSFRITAEQKNELSAQLLPLGANRQGK